MKTQDLDYCRKQFGRFVRTARENLDLTQYDLADLMEVSQPLICYVERGERDIDLPLAVKICKILNVDLIDFLKTL